MSTFTRILVCIIALALFSCTHSRRYFNMRIGHEREQNTVQPHKDQKTKDTAEQKALLPPAKTETTEIKKDSSLNKVTNRENEKKSNSILQDTATILPLGNEEMFNFKAARKKYGRKGPPPFVAAGLLFLVFILAVLGVIFAGIFIYTTSWKISTQNLVFICLLIMGYFLCQRFNEWWQNYADSD